MNLPKFAARCIACFLALGCFAGISHADLASDFRNPPPSAKPWVYWFWLNGNITREGITADLEAMQRAGIGGVLIMEVDQGAPVGPVDFMGPKWRGLFKHVAREANRLGLGVDMNNDAGWQGSGGPWIKPENSMQKVVVSETDVEGPKHFEGVLSQPPTTSGFYRDISVVAVPAGVPCQVPGIEIKRCDVGWFDAGGGGFPGPAEVRDLPAGSIISPEKIIDLTAKMDKGGKLTWDAPIGKWTVFRFGHTSTGANNSPPPATGRGLECDRLSKEGSEAAFNGMMAKLIEDIGPLAGKSLVSTHIDSWESGSQNWTANMREEFIKRRGYDPLPWLVVVTGRVVDSLEQSERFLWDLRQTISELLIENYAGHMRELANKHGLRLSIEAYGSPCDDLPYGGRADEPMAEFWMEPYGSYMFTAKLMSSAAHTYGRNIVGAEAFTSDLTERWRQHPATIKALGDQVMCDGVNKFVFHRYAMQPWTNPDRVPGMMMGPWGLHYERTQSWWEMSRAWHKYLSRCHYMLRHGLFVADICYLQREASPQSYTVHDRHGYDSDNISAEALLTRATVKNGRITLPDGMSYRILALPDTPEMTPKLLNKIKELIDAGALVVGTLPVRSPSLENYPKCDDEVKSLADQIRSRVQNKTPEQALADLGVAPDFAADSGLRYIHRRTPDADIYFVANPQPFLVNTMATFRVSGKHPELWNPETGRAENAAVFSGKGGCTSVALSLGASESVFVVFKKPVGKINYAMSLTKNGQSLLSVRRIVITKATYGVLSDPTRTWDVKAKAQAIVDGGQSSFVVAKLADGDDPAFGIVKTAIIDYTLNGKPYTATGVDTDTLRLASDGLDTPVSQLCCDSAGRLILEARQPGNYDVGLATGKTVQVKVSNVPEPQAITGPWNVSFDAKMGGPANSVVFTKLEDWSKRPEDGIKYYSGTAMYKTSFKFVSPKPGNRLYLDLGKVAVMAEIKLNGKNLGIAWKSPYRVEITDAVRPGDNSLEIKVANLLINRMIGDEQMPEDSERNGDGTLRYWPKWVEEGKPSPSGRYTFADWLLWHKGDPLQESGLLGPVVVCTVRQVPVR